MTLIDHLMARAEGHWGNHDPLPLDLFAEMISAGIDVDGAERAFKNKLEQ